MSSRFRSVRWLLAAIPAVILAGSLASGPTDRASPRRAYALSLAPALPSRVDSAFAKLVQRLSEPGGYFDNLSAIQDRADRIQALLDNRQDNQCQSRPPQSDAPRKRRTRVVETTPLSQISWRKNVARQSPEDTFVGSANRSATSRGRVAA